MHKALFETDGNKSQYIYDQVSNMQLSVLNFHAPYNPS